jgi:hypothetical protein
MGIVVIAVAFVLGGISMLLHPDTTPGGVVPDGSQPIIAVAMMVGGSIVLIQVARGIVRLRRDLDRARRGEPRDPSN